jgi:hypothetical protein
LKEETKLWQCSPIVILNVPLRLVSESNSSEHWLKKAKRHTQQQWLVKAALNKHDLTKCLPCTVKLVRLSPRKFDSDNLQGAFKWIRDQVADCLIPGKKKGMADNDSRITWLYDQERSSTHAIRIEISPSTP